jgi:predicted nucleic acid-binding protein
MIVVDTSVWIDYFNGRPTPEANLLDSLLERERLAIGDLVLAELLQGFRSDLDFRRGLDFLSAFKFLAMVGREVAVDSARNYRRLRARGVSVRKTIDVMIGTFCIQNGHQLLHADRDFDPMERYLGLSVVRE